MVFSTSFQKMLRTFHNDGIKIATAIIHGFTTTEEMDYLTCRGEMISFLPRGKNHQVNEESGRWLRTGRQEGKPSRVIRKIITRDGIDRYELKESDFEKFGYSVRAYIMINGDGDPDSQLATATIVVCNGDFIPHYYNGDNYAPDIGGNLAGSCMRNKDEDFFTLYAYNHKVCHMAVALTAHHKVLGRALLWKTDEYGWCMDSIYAEDHVKPMFIHFAIENGMRYKAEQSCHHNDFDMFNGERIGCGNVSAKLQEWDFNQYPYLDTLFYMDTNYSQLQNYCDGADRELRSTDGEFTDLDDNEVECIASGSYYPEDDCYYVEYQYEGRWVDGHAFYDFVVSDGHGNRFLREHCVEINGAWYLRDDEDLRYSDHDGCYYHMDDVVYVEADRDYRHIDDCVEIDHEWYAKEDCVKDHNGNWIHSDDAIEVDGITYHKDEYEEQTTDEQLNETV